MTPRPSPARRGGGPPRPPTPGTGPRSLAVEALIRIDAGAWANLVLPALLGGSNLAPRDRALVTDLVYGTVRGLGRVDHLLGLASDRPLDALDAPVRAALRLGAHQLDRGIPPHAAVDSAVGALTGRAARGRGYVNAVLRKLVALGPPWPWPEGDSVEAVAVCTSHPAWLVERLRDDLGFEAAAAVLDADNETPAVSLRPNPLRTDADRLRGELEAAGVRVETGRLIPDAVLVSGIGDPAQLPAVAEGRATPQDQASQAVAAAVGARPEEAVLDLAAAPGGKSTALAEAMADRGLVAAGDLSAGRLRLVTTAARRLGLSSVRSVVADGRSLPFRPGVFDRVLLDAPCSGLGVLRRRPDARWRAGPDDATTMAELQRELFRSAAGAVRPGGVLVYSVCTLTAEETVGIDGWTAEQFPHLRPLGRPGGPWRPHGRGALLLPSDAGADGMFMLLLQHEGG